MLHGVGTKVKCVGDEVFGKCQMIFVESDEIDHTKF